jgi:hypothetical protein
MAMKKALHSCAGLGFASNPAWTANDARSIGGKPTPASVHVPGG